MQTFDFDHVQQPSSGDATSVLLAYIDILSPEFPELYQGLFERKDETNLRIILRWKPSQDKIRRSKLVLSGYGVGLDLKRVDYITIDDRDLATQDSGKAKEQRTQKVEAEAEAGSQITEDVFAEADAEPSELIQLKSEQLLGTPRQTCMIALIPCLLLIVAQKSALGRPSLSSLRRRL